MPYPTQPASTVAHPTTIEPEIFTEADPTMTTTILPDTTTVVTTMPPTSMQTVTSSGLGWISNFHEMCVYSGYATCDFTTGAGESGTGTIQGSLDIWFWIDCRGPAQQSLGLYGLEINGELSGNGSGFSNGQHGLHIHEGYDMTTCSSLGGHWKGDSTSIHGHPYQPFPERHMGDLGNINVAENMSTVYAVAESASLDEAVGRGMVVHALRDDYNPQRDPDSTGNAGARLACCTIQYSDVPADKQWRTV